MAEIKKTLRKRRGTAKVQFCRFTNAFGRENKNTANTEGLKPILLDTEGAYKDVEARHQECTEALDSEDDTDRQELDLKEEDMEKIYQEMCTERPKIANIQKLQKPTIIVSATATSETSTRPKTAESLKVKMLDIPTCSGRIKDYPNINNDYEAHVVASYGKDPYALTGILSGEAMDTVKGADDDYEEMFR